MNFDRFLSNLGFENRETLTEKQLGSLRSLHARCHPGEGEAFVGTGRIAQLTGVIQHHVQQLAIAGKIPFSTVGKTRVFNVEDVAKIRLAAVEAGYLTEA